MKISRNIKCKEFPCPGVRHENYMVPDIEVKPEDISIIMISEAAPPDPADYYYAKGAFFCFLLLLTGDIYFP